MTQKHNLPVLFTQNEDNFIEIAHRGASADYPENTMAAFKAAVTMDAEMIELDVLLSKDGVPMVIHDATLGRTTNARGRVKDLTAQELKKLDAGSWFDSTFAGEQIPTLEEVLAFASGTIALNIEIKTEAVSNDRNDGIEAKCLALVEKYDMEKHVLFSSFDYRAVQRLKEQAPQMPVAILYEKRQSQKKLPSELLHQYKADAFNCSYNQLNRKRLANLKQHHIPFFVYTVDERHKMRKLIALGARGIFTNKPDVLREVINSGS